MRREGTGLMPQMHRCVTVVLLVAAVVAMRGAGAQPAAPGTFDVLIRNARVLDGTGNPWYRADVGIRGDRIAAVGALGGARAATVVDAQDAMSPRGSSTSTRTPAPAADRRAQAWAAGAGPGHHHRARQS